MMVLKFSLVCKFKNLNPVAHSLQATGFGLQVSDSVYNIIMSPASKYVLKKLLKLSAVSVLLLFLVLNIAASQFLPGAYFSFVEGDRASAVLLLKAVKLLPEFPILAQRQRQIYGESIDSELYITEKNRKQNIIRLEQIRTRYPKSRDVLLGLYLLYNEEGDAAKARMYLEQAQAIDPAAGNM